MPASASARRYASAAFNVAGQSGEYDRWLQALREITRVLRMPSARAVLMSPAVPAAQKTAVLDRVLPNAPPMVRNFVHILVNRDRVLEVLGEVRHVGPLGHAARLKLVANSMLGITSAAAGELYNAGLRAGLDRQRVWEILTRFVPYLDARRAGYLDGKVEPAMFRVADLVKDLRLAHDLYGQAGADAPLTETTRELFERVAGDHGEQDIAAIAELWREPSAAQKTARR